MVEELIKDLQGSIGSTVSGVFALVPLAEEAMRVAGLTKKQQTELFLELNPAGFIGYTPRLYEVHVAELCGRKKAGEDLKLGTVAEVMMALCETSLKAPLGQIAAVLYQQLFAESFGKDAVEGVDISEPWEGACSELLCDMRRRLARARAPK